MTNELARLSAATKALAEAKSLDEVTQIRDYAKAAATYATAAKLGRQAQNDAIEVQLLAERKAGEMLAVMPRIAPVEYKHKGSLRHPNRPLSTTWASQRKSPLRGRRWLTFQKNSSRPA